MVPCEGQIEPGPLRARGSRCSPCALRQERAKKKWGSLGGAKPEGKPQNSTTSAWAGTETSKNILAWPNFSGHSSCQAQPCRGDSK